MVEKLNQLSIVILTRNRKKELLFALKSCVDCTLPPNTEFVIVDNASEQEYEVKKAVMSFFANYPYEYRYYYYRTNLGVAQGRNQGLKNAKGRYVYFIDDDAYIEGPKEIFFEKMIHCFQNNEQVGCISTAIYDLELNAYRFVRKSKMNDDPQSILVFMGGSFMIDRFRLKNMDQLFLENSFYGGEELYPSLQFFFSNKYVKYLDDLTVIHNPSVNSRINRKTAIPLHYAVSTTTKLIFYPRILYPIIYLAYISRIIKHLNLYSLPKAIVDLQTMNKLVKKETVSFREFMRLVSEFGLVAVI